MTPPLLLIEDTPALRFAYRAVLEAAGHTITAAATAAAGLRAFHAEEPRVVLLDLMLPDRDGLSVMREMLAARPGTRIIVITSNASINQAVEAMRAGAHDFLVKPVDEQRIIHSVENALRVQETPPPAPGARPRHNGAPPTQGFLGSSAAMTDIHAKIRSVAPSMATVFITGESGTGKEICAQSIHDLSPRARGPFIALNCGAIPTDLLESEVFGHVRGAFTGAVGDKPGAAVAADGGTLFLDEVCEMDLALQPKLLRFLQTSTVTPVGATKPRKVDVRIVCATNRDPLEAVRRGTFREDLFYRLFVVPIHMPPLRERGDDVVEIAEAALTRFAAEEGRGFAGLDGDVKALLRSLPWPGNVRQLLNVIRNVVVLNDGPLVTPAMLPDRLVESTDPAAPDGPALPPAAPGIETLAGRTLAEIEQLVIEAAIARHGGSVPRAARELDVAPSTLYRKRDGWARGGQQP
ncbi:sigma-54-dependent transcriptional regulator [Ruixingdingia sedimenti]|uniref:Sigma-54 dependent transcriptional regulator n=1 Tax=Ruixingdingia sedimenti TaxID=3073604 RepID=A0ABU1FCL7_9RHOB|nr:sigma-54 dependent transcriptional regulator [Xinfangfangia sp. LG-4]MDR5654610.1 sigma-54 dependent transcriptional regulator [Xinfangfangia sp. LG-4]